MNKMKKIVLLLVPIVFFISLGYSQSTKVTINGSTNNVMLISKGTFRSDSGIIFTVGDTLNVKYDSVGNTRLRPQDSKLYIKIAASGATPSKWVALNTSGGGGGSTDTTSLSNRINVVAAKQPYFYVTDYGAVDDSTTDNTTAIQNTINAAFAAGGGVVYFPYKNKGQYLVKGPILTSDPLGNPINNAQLYTPFVPYNKVDVAPTITLLSDYPPIPVSDYDTGLVHKEPTKTVQIISTLGGTNRGALFGSTYGTGTWGNWNFTQLFIKNLTFVVRSVTNAGVDTIPTLSALDFTNQNMSNLENVKVKTQSYLARASAPLQGITGIKGPVNLNFNATNWNNIFVQGFDIGLTLSENVVIHNTNINGCDTGIVLNQGDHAITITKSIIQWCKVNVAIDGQSNFDFGSLDIENYLGVVASGLTPDKWFNNTWDVYEASNTGSIGNIRHRMTNAWLGYTVQDLRTQIYSPLVSLNQLLFPISHAPARNSLQTKSLYATIPNDYVVGLDLKTVTFGSPLSGATNPRYSYLRVPSTDTRDSTSLYFTQGYGNNTHGTDIGSPMGDVRIGSTGLGSTGSFATFYSGYLGNNGSLYLSALKSTANIGFTVTDDTALWIKQSGNVVIPTNKLGIGLGYGVEPTADLQTGSASQVRFGSLSAGGVVYSDNSGNLTNTPTNGISITPAKYYGILYNKNTWSNLTDFTQDSVTASLSSNKIVITDATGLSSLDYNYYSLLSHWNTVAKVKATSTSASVGVGTRSTNIYQNFDVNAALDFNTGTLRLITRSRVLGLPDYDTVATSATNLTVNTNDYILVNIYRVVDTIYATARNITTGSNYVTATYGYKSNTYTQGSHTVATPNTGKFCVYANNGSFTLDSLVISSNELVNSNVLIATDSKGLYTANNFNSIWPQLISNMYYPSVVSIAGTEGIRDVLNRVPEIIALNPKKVLLMIGRNDVINNYNYVANYDTVVAQLTRSNITVLHSTGFYETVTDVSGLATFIRTTFPTNYIETYFPSVQIPNLLNADNVHLNQSGHNLMANTIINSGLLNYGLNYSDMTRLSVQPFSFSYTYTPTNASAVAAGIVTLGTQTLGTGTKTMDEVVTNTSFDLPNTSNSTTGVIKLNGGVVMQQYNGNSNFFTGYNAGNFTLTNYNNAGFGSNALNNLTSGGSNAGFGVQSLYVNQDGSFNTALGAFAGKAQTTGDNNTFIGNSAGQHSTNNNNNLLIGQNAGVNIYTAANGGGSASYNLMIGNGSGSNTNYDGSYNVVIGHNGLQYTSAIPNNKFCVTGGSTFNNILYGDFNTGQLQVNASGLAAPTLTGNVAFEVISTTGGIQPPRFTTSAKNALTSQAIGTTVADTTLKTLSFYNGTAWSIVPSYVTGTGISSTTVNNFITSQNTGSSNYTATVGYNYYNPATLTSALTITMPASPVDGDNVTFLFGGTILINSTVITTLTVSPNSGQSIYGAITLNTAKGGDVAQYTYQAANTRWFRIK